MATRHWQHTWMPSIQDHAYRSNAVMHRDCGSTNQMISVDPATSVAVEELQLFELAMIHHACTSCFCCVQRHGQSQAFR